ncbi:BTB domain-containing protein [Mycena sanguinolenta]|uniref:BTB domain-containing protein n=1 Tax=Mycena sanguinolenta TaxID=230812 RepID=A0A8H6Y0L9_9AGAR|nr:BTB domain-containing protein [Mycena sanguinolenta]
MSSPSAKRQRTEHASITRSNIWYRDGSVVLQTESTQFRVHWGLLSQHSPFFRDLENIPQPPDEPTIDGCPIVELQDSAVDVEHLLTALYDPTFLSQTALPLAIVGALIRLGRKYDFKNLLDSAVARLTFQNPTTLEEYDNLIADGNYNLTRITSYPGYALDLLTLARENNLGLVLPVAYYRALICDPLQLLEGTKMSGEKLASLSVDDLYRCLIGRQKLVTKQYQPGYTLGWLREWPYTDCRNPEGCGAKRKLKFHSYMDRNTVKAFVMVPSEQRAIPGICATCHQHVTESINEGRKKMWEELPGFFDLPPWNELKNDL